MGPVTMEEALRSFSGKRVFVTGHTGFKGSWLTLLLIELGAEVTGFALEPESNPNHFDLLGLRGSISNVFGDIRELSSLSASVSAADPEVVIHMAAQALVGRSYTDPVGTFSTNLLGSVNLMQAVRACDSVRSLVFVTSDKCYENMEWVWGYRENDRLGGHDPYSASKAAAELAFESFSRSFFRTRSNLGAATVRAGNVIGGGDWSEDRIVPDCIRAASRGEAVELRNPSATRPWQHVLEPISGYLLVAANLMANPIRYGGSWNFGPTTDQVRTVEGVANVIMNAFGLDCARVGQEGMGNHEANLLQLNCEKARQMLGWTPRWGVDEALLATAKWYKSVAEGHDARGVTLGQILDYFPELR